MNLLNMNPKGSHLIASFFRDYYILNFTINK
ncbi:Uncharacterised protein [Klebsiella variicola]|nr:Uncharacterised protein [Klebsiella pneumoniae]VAT76896.1 Uncharacterised protein [Klebsiella variicola]